MSSYPYSYPFQESVATYEQARRIMRTHGSACYSDSSCTSILSWSWPEEEVRQRFGERDDFLWFDRVLELERLHYASPCSFSGCWSMDRPIEEWGEMDITATGVLVLATLY